MRAYYREKTYICGDYMDVQIFPVYAKAGVRRSKAKPTSETQARYNEQNSKRHFTRLVHTNFRPGDIALHLTYSDDYLPETEEQARADVQKFLRRLRRLYRAAENELKYIWVCEKGEKRGRVHHHLILNAGLSRDVIETLWEKGYANSKRLKFEKNGVSGLTHYMTKQTLFFRRWNASKNLLRPIEKTNDYRISGKKAAEMVEFADDSELFEKMYPGYEYSECYARGNEINGGKYIYLQLVRKQTNYMQKGFHNGQSEQTPRKSSAKTDSL